MRPAMAAIIGAAAAGTDAVVASTNAVAGARK